VRAGKLTSLQVGRPADVDSRGNRVRTAIVKTLVAGPVRLDVSGFEGDELARRSACSYRQALVAASAPELADRRRGAIEGSLDRLL
jgi:MOSC domain-containing protein YiiM